MAEAGFKLSQTEDKAAAYEEFIERFKLYIDGETDEISVFANTAAALREAFGFFWVGFYLVKDGELKLGPFHSNVACMHIAFGRGVCGSAWAQAKTLVVPDVDLFPGHIACSSASRSEIVVPVFKGDKVCAVLDIDSTDLDSFGETDKTYLEKLCRHLESCLWA